MDSDTPSPLGILGFLPRELRDQIYEAVFTPGELFLDHRLGKDPSKNTNWDRNVRTCTEKMSASDRSMCWKIPSLRSEIFTYIYRKQIEATWLYDDSYPFALLQTSSAIRNEAFRCLDYAYSKNWIVMNPEDPVEVQLLSRCLNCLEETPTIRKFEMSFAWTDSIKARQRLWRQRSVDDTIDRRRNRGIECSEKDRERMLDNVPPEEWIKFGRYKWGILEKRPLWKLDHLTLDFRNASLWGRHRFKKPNGRRSELVEVELVDYCLHRPKREHSGLFFTHLGILPCPRKSLQILADDEERGLGITRKILDTWANPPALVL